MAGSGGGLAALALAATLLFDPRPAPAETADEAAPRLETQLPPSDPLVETWRQRARALREKGDLAGAEAVLLKGLKRDPHAVSVLRDLAKLYIEANRTPEALPLLEHALSIDPQDRETRDALSYVLYQTGDAVRSLAVSKEGRPLGPAEAEALVEAARFYAVWGRQEAAVRALAKARELAPENPAVVRALAQLTDAKAVSSVPAVRERADGGGEKRSGLVFGVGLGSLALLLVAALRLRGRVARAPLDPLGEECPLEVRVLQDGQPAEKARIGVRGEPASLRYTREGRTRLVLPRGRYEIVVAGADRVLERPIEVRPFEAQPLEIELSRESDVVFSGCEDAVEPYLEGDFPAAASALERAGKHALARQLRAEHHRARGELAEAASLYESAGRWVDAAELWTSRGELALAALLFERAGDLPRAADTWLAAGDLLRAGEAFAAAEEYASAAECFREAGATDRLLRVLEKEEASLAAGARSLKRGQTWRSIQHHQARVAVLSGLRVRFQRWRQKPGRFMFRP
jgi:tetratricopeptide (TPR) repeat protein